VKEAALHYEQFCRALRIDLTKPDTRDTPSRVARMMAEDFLVGNHSDHLTFTTFPADKTTANQLVTVANMRFVSICAHHHLPYYGVCHACYLPNKRLAGLSKIPRLIQWRARVPSMQEEVTNLLLMELQKRLQPRFVGVQVVAEHTCMACRGVNEYNSVTVTTAFWCTDTSEIGAKLDMADFDTTKQEFFRAIEEAHRHKERT
jgi:GTP cyclohydrolase I